MKRILTAILSIALLLGAWAAPVSASHSSPACGDWPQLIGYRDNNQTGELLGVLCGNTGTLAQAWDANFSDSSGAFRGSDNDAMSSWKLYQPRNETWCLLFHRDASFGGSTQHLSLGHSSTWWGPSGGVMPPTWNNNVSSVQIFKKGTAAC